MAENLVAKFKGNRADKTTKDILIGLNHVIEGSVAMSNQVKVEQGSDEIKDWIDDSNEARNKYQQAKVTQNIFLLLNIPKKPPFFNLSIRLEFGIKQCD